MGSVEAMQAKAEVAQVWSMKYEIFGEASYFGLDCRRPCLQVGIIAQ